jgi:transposase-like protein
MENSGVVVRRRRSRAEGARLVEEFEQSGLRRQEFCAVHGLNVATLDGWRRRVARRSEDQKIVPVELVARRSEERRPVFAPLREGTLRVLTPGGLRIEVESGFDAIELRRLLAALGGAE